MQIGTGAFVDKVHCPIVEAAEECGGNWIVF